MNTHQAFTFILLHLHYQYFKTSSIANNKTMLHNSQSMDITCPNISSGLLLEYSIFYMFWIQDKMQCNVIWNYIALDHIGIMIFLLHVQAAPDHCFPTFCSLSSSSGLTVTLCGLVMSITNGRPATSHGA